MSQLTFPPKDGNNRHYEPYYRQLIRLKNDEDLPQSARDGIDMAVRLNDARDRYVEKVCTPPGRALQGIEQFTQTTDWEELHRSGKTHSPLGSHIMTGHVEGLFLKFLVSMQQAKYVLDIGMFTGYSALAMAEALPADGKVFTVDREQYLADVNRKVFDSAPHGKKIEIRLGDAIDIINSLAKDGIQVDFVFLDAAHSQYGDFVDLLLKKNILSPRGTIAVDNTLWSGKAYLEQEDDIMVKFNKKIMEDSRVERIVLPVRDGIMLIRRTEAVNGQ